MHVCVRNSQQDDLFVHQTQYPFDSTLRIGGHLFQKLFLLVHSNSRWLCRKFNANWSHSPQCPFQYISNYEFGPKTETLTRKMVWLWFWIGHLVWFDSDQSINYYPVSHPSNDGLFLSKTWNQNRIRFSWNRRVYFEFKQSRPFRATRAKNTCLTNRWQMKMLIIPRCQSIFKHWTARR